MICPTCHQEVDELLWRCPTCKVLIGALTKEALEKAIERHKCKIKKAGK